MLSLVMHPLLPIEVSSIFLPSSIFFFCLIFSEARFFLGKNQEKSYCTKCHSGKILFLSREKTGEKYLLFHYAIRAFYSNKRIMYAHGRPPARPTPCRYQSKKPQISAAPIRHFPSIQGWRAGGACPMHFEKEF